LPVTVELSVLSAVASKQATRKGAPVQPVGETRRTTGPVIVMVVIVIVKVSANKTHIF
jgi:hypothetical protein